MPDEQGEKNIRFLLETLIADGKSNGAKLDEVLAGHRRLTNHFLRIAQRQVRDREMLRRHERELERLHGAVFPHEPPLQRPTTPLMAWQPTAAPIPAMRPPAPSEPDSAIHDLEALRAEAARDNFVDREMRRESWWYRTKRQAPVTIATALLVAALTALATWAATRVRIGAHNVQPRPALVRR